MKIFNDDKTTDIYIKDFLNTCLRDTMSAIQAECGSLFLFKEDNRELVLDSFYNSEHLKINGLTQRIGEGISGIAAKEGESFVIDDTIDDNRIKRHLNRPYISSSMVVPIKIDSRVLGVMNLGTLKTSPVRFDLGNMQLIKRLIELATVALQN